MTGVVKFGGKKKGSWEERLSRTRDNEVKPTLYNLTLVIENDVELKGMFALDEFANRVVLKRDPPWTGAQRSEFSEVDGTELSAWLGNPDRYAMNVKSTTVLEAVEAIARRYRFHPVREYLDGLVWDQTPRIASMFPTFFGAEDSTYTRRVAEILMLSAVGRIYKPGCQVDSMLILEGAQGAGKTQVTKALFSGDWYAESKESPASKDFYLTMLGRWCVEIEEMESFSKAEAAKIKQAVTVQSDTFRPPYGRYSRSFPRQTVLVGTTNEEHYLKDATGGRRFLPIKVATIKVAECAAVRDQLWAEAVYRFRHGETWWPLPEGAAEQQDARFQEDSWREPIQRWLAGQCDDERYKFAGFTRTAAGEVESCSTTEIMSGALHVEIAKHTKADQMRVAPVMRRLGWINDRRLRGGMREHRWYRTAKDPDEVPF